MRTFLFGGADPVSTRCYVYGTKLLPLTTPRVLVPLTHAAANGSSLRRGAGRLGRNAAPRQGRDSGLVRPAEWIPAFAGMTTLGRVSSATG
jgi:hypothetical protein